ncbi:pyruvate dehydrogenase (acetyl-transferring) E1 component subunit alpha [Natronomonas sp. F2-12]|jgi:pyruvate dehydrogenase E1 component alpha subunit|uniref:Pyruvate dehydrogenase (Acetyl-transferring) E1 component subunit alpha n=1 Tax=Natronomonas aquatica TaxID=2841590 RepID=A0A9R1CUF7_9EURY|nr:thiamine pyrophosphate-dependent enzyme [Natronomonas aquatica]MCQ4333864.1 pyruvate dehydrogenase (acetyl-transferring) E1 component subunit alpha [Natronomonas aquatica]
MARFPEEYDDCERILAPDGSYDAEAVAALDLTDEELRGMYGSMIQARALEERGLTLQRQGEFHFWMECRGLEASHVGPAAALSDRDWMNTEWRQYGAQIQRGRPLEDILLFWLRGYEEWAADSIAEMEPYERRMPHIVAVGTQLPQTAGLMWGRKLQGKDEVGLVSVGDGGASKGDFHAGLNFAGALELPVVFLLLNNQWAISTPVERQTAADTYADRAAGYGFEGTLVDGNDVLATYRATKRAVEAARAGEPHLLEVLTYRRGAHSSSDADDYRENVDIEAWRERDPIDRYETFLEDRGLLGPDDFESIREAAEERAREAAESALEIAETQSPEEVFDEVFANPPDYVDDQREELLDLVDRHGEAAFRW